MHIYIHAAVVILFVIHGVSSPPQYPDYDNYDISSYDMLYDYPESAPLLTQFSLIYGPFWVISSG